jgi:glycerol-3-phosphate acyltransferase PlsY
MLILGAYLIGSFPTGWLVVRLLTGQDVRRIGSGRTGGTNAMRAGGLRPGCSPAWGILGKGSWRSNGPGCCFPGQPLAWAVAGILVVAGHNWPIWLGFRGGAGTAPNLGAAIALWLPVAAVLLPLVPLLAALTGYASMTSLILAFVVPGLFALRAVAFGGPWAEVLYGLGTLGLIVWALRPNFRRLREGTEPRLRFSGQPKASASSGLAEGKERSMTSA